eukprot:UN29760
MLEYLERKDMDDDTFLKSLEGISLMTFDHYNKLRAIWLYLQREGRRNGLKKIFNSFAKYEKDDYHCTLTYFWAQLIHYAQVSQIRPIKDFKQFLLVNPCLTNDKYYLKYYKPSIVTNKKAKQEMVMPTLCKLPSIVQTDSLKNKQKDNSDNTPKLKKPM